jgi:hypothetical protein
MLLMVMNADSRQEEPPMEDLWRVKRSSVDMNDLADLAEYHHFLDRFRLEELDDHRRRLLYGDHSFGATDKKDAPG